MEFPGFYRMVSEQNANGMQELSFGAAFCAYDSVRVVGPHSALATRTVAARGRLFAPVTRVDAKLRYRSPVVAARVVPAATGFRLDLDEPAYGVARGQAAVLYDGDVVVGSGLVTSAAAG